MPGSIRSMHVEHVFRDVQTDRGSLLHGRLLRWQFDTATLAHRCRRGASTPSPTAAGFPTIEGGPPSTHSGPLPRRNVKAVVPIIRLSVGKRSDVDQGETTLTIELTLAIAIWLGIGADQHLAREDEMRLFPCALIAAASLVVSGGVGVADRTSN